MSEEKKREKLRRLVIRQQDRETPLTIRDAARMLKMPHEAVQDMAYDMDMNVNVAIGCGNRISCHQRVGDYTLEILNP